MWNFDLKLSFSLMKQTLPFILLRAAVYFSITLAYILATGIGAGIGWGVGALGDGDFQSQATVWGGTLGFGVVAAIAYWFREYLLYMVKAGHIAVLVELLDNRSIPQGRSQIEHAQKVVKERFAEASVLFAIDQLIKGALGAITGLIRGMLSFIPINGIRQLVSIIEAFLKVAMGFVDEVILAYSIKTGSTDPWDSARDGLILYGQNYKVMLKNAAWLTLFIYALSLVVFLLMLAPAAVLVYLMPGAITAGGFVFAILFAWSFKVALLDPFAITCLMQVYFRTIEGQEPNPEWEAKLNKMSAKFGKLKPQAAN